MSRTRARNEDSSGNERVTELEKSSIKSIDYFPEPATPDESTQGWDETSVQWLVRSTQPTARAVREFLNRSLACFAPKHARSLAKKLHADFQSHFFEVVVGRYLQVLGAEIEPEPLGTNDTRIDFRATFADGVVASVECVSKRFNAKALQTIERHEKMARVLDDAGPTNWAIEFRRLPDSRSQDEFRLYVEKAQEFYSTLPEPAAGGQRFQFVFDGDQGRIELEAIPFPKRTKPNHVGPAVAFRDNSIERLKYALKDPQKRKQARGAVPPVFLAIDCPFNGPDAEDFDQALFGQTVDHRDFHSGTSLGITFNPNGLLVTDKGIPFAGVLAFLKLSMLAAADPVLYLNPYQRRKLPAALASHQTRVWTSGIKRTEATREPIINLVGFVEWLDLEPSKK
jgi:hypothetical protein